MLLSQTKQISLAFGDNIYVIATTLDPRFALQRVDEDVSTNEEYSNDKERIYLRNKKQINKVRRF